MASLRKVLFFAPFFQVIIVLLCCPTSGSYPAPADHQNRRSHQLKEEVVVSSIDDETFCLPHQSDGRIFAEYHIVSSTSGSGNVSHIKICSCNWLAIAATSLKFTVSSNQCESGFSSKHLFIDYDASAGYTTDPSVRKAMCIWTKSIDPAILSSITHPNGSQLLLCPAFNPSNKIPSISLTLDNKDIPQSQDNKEHAVVESNLLPASEIDGTHGPAVVTGLRVETGKAILIDEDGAAMISAGSLVSVRLFGYNFQDSSQFRIVWSPRQKGEECDNLPFSTTVQGEKDFMTNHSTLVKFRLPSANQILDSNAESDVLPAFYLCSLERNKGQNHWIHQGTEPGVKMRSYESILPLWIQIIFITLLLTLSGIFSGLNLGLMSLDRTDLKIYENTGTEEEKRYAKAITPVRNHGNYLLCTLLLGNVLVNSTLTILMDDLTSGAVAIVLSTLGIVILGEIIPQAVCSRFGLAIGAHTVWITKFFMLITFPLSYPTSLVLDLILGKEIGAFYNRERLTELIKVTEDYHGLEKEEVNIIAGALEMRKKTVRDVMTHLDDAFMLSIDSVLDFETVSEIMKQGFSRVPVYQSDRNNLVGLLFIKELALVDPEDATPLKTVCQFYQKKLNFVLENTTLDVVLKDFKEGHKGHMAFVRRSTCIDGESVYETIGLVTLEDVIEELIQAEIVDESDVWMDNRSKRRREKSQLLQDFSSYAVHYRSNQRSTRKISPQLALATFQFLSSTIPAFKTKWISENVLQRLMRQGLVIRFIRIKDVEHCETDPDTFLYQKGKPVDYFVLVLEGRVQVQVGKENMVFETGPFCYFGSQVLTDGEIRPRRNSKNRRSHSIAGGASSRNVDFQKEINDMNQPPTHLITDYTVRAITDLVYFRISRALYEAARNATIFEKSNAAAAVKQGLKISQQTIK